MYKTKKEVEPMKKKVIGIMLILAMAAGTAACAETGTAPAAETAQAPAAEEEQEPAEEEKTEEAPAEEAETEEAPAAEAESSKTVDAESADALFDAFLRDEIAAEDGENTVKYSELVEYNELWEEKADNREERLDLDNDGENELMIAGGFYGGVYLDVSDGKLFIFARGEGTTGMLSYTNFEDAVWIVHSDITHMGRQMHHLDRYEGSDNIVESFDINAEYWDSESDMYNEKSDFTYRGQKLTMQEYESKMKEIFGTDTK